MARIREFDEEKVIEIATELFWTKGYNAVSTKDLIDAFGISRSSMYAAYKDKKSLFILALQHYRQTNAKVMVEAMKKYKPFKEIIGEILHALINETIKDFKNKGCFMVNTAIELAPHDRDILKIIRDNRTTIINAISTAIQKGIDKGEISDKKNPTALATYYFNLINGLRVDAKIHKTKSHYKETVEIALASLD